MKTPAKVEIVPVEKANCITHAGKFHADEVTSTAVLSLLLDEVRVARVAEVAGGGSEHSCTAEHEDLARAARSVSEGHAVLASVPTPITYDIGYGKYDHHQPAGNGARPNGVPYSSVGLIWRDFGRQLVSSDQAWELVDRELISGIDALDNGAYQASSYPATPMTFSAAIENLNPLWDSYENPDQQFLKAVTLAQQILIREIESAEAKVRAATEVDAAIAQSENHIITLEKLLPWKDCFFTNSTPQADDTLYVIYPSARGGYNVQAVPEAPGSFACRKSFPKSWHGLKDADLAAASGVPDATFCHKSGFLAGAKSLEGAKKLAELAVQA